MKKNKEFADLNEKTNELGSGFWISFTDLISCLLLVLMLLIISLRSFQISPDEFNDLKSKYDLKVKELDSEIKMKEEIENMYRNLSKQFQKVKDVNKDLNIKLKQYSNTDVILNDIVSKIRDELVYCGNRFFYGIDFDHFIILNKESNTIRISEKVLNFELGESTIKSESSKLYIKKCIARVLYSELESVRSKNVIDSVFIEGHTDDNPYLNDTRNIKNWNLSAERAIEFWFQLRSSLYNLDSIRNKKGEPLFSVSGYADTRPVSVCLLDNSSKKQRCSNNNLTKEQSDERNRRIDIKFKALYLPVNLE